MSRIIRINDCKECPSRDHKGGFGTPAYVPVCRKASRELPYTVGLNHRMVARQNEGIPDWCPLDAAVPVHECKPLTVTQIEEFCAVEGFTNWSEWDGGEYQQLWINLTRRVEKAHGIT